MLTRFLFKNIFNVSVLRKKSHINILKCLEWDNYSHSNYCKILSFQVNYYSLRVSDVLHFDCDQT